MQTKAKHFSINLPVNLLFAKYFIAIKFGKDTRAIRFNAKETERRGKQTPVVTKVSWVFVFWMFLGTLMLTFVALYLIKSALNINVFAGAHPLRDLLTWIGICKH